LKDSIHAASHTRDNINYHTNRKLLVVGKSTPSLDQTTCGIGSPYTLHASRNSRPATTDSCCLWSDDAFISATASKKDISVSGKSNISEAYSRSNAQTLKTDHNPTNHPFYGHNTGKPAIASTSS